MFFVGWLEWKKVKFLTSITLLLKLHMFSMIDPKEASPGSLETNLPYL